MTLAALVQLVARDAPTEAELQALRDRLPTLVDLDTFAQASARAARHRGRLCTLLTDRKDDAR